MSRWAALPLLLISATAEAAYEVEVTLGTYDEIRIGGTVHAPSPYAIGFPAEDEGFVEIPLPFPVEWFGVPEDRVYVYTNGFLAFSPPPAGNTGILGPPGAVPNVNGRLHGYLGVMWADLEADPTPGKTPEIRTLLRGSAPNRTFTVQVKDYRRRQTASSAVNFQVRFGERGQIEIVMGQNALVSGATTAIEDWLGLFGQNLLADGGECGASCVCAPRTCRSLNWPEGLTIALYPPAEAELIGAVSGPAGAYPGDAFSVTVRVTNTGTTAAADVGATLVLSTDAVVDATDLELAALELGDLLGRASITRQLTPTMPPGLPVGRYFLGLVVDPADRVREASEANNASYDPQGIANGPDLSGRLRGPMGSGPGEVVSVDLEIDNHGAPFLGPVSVDLVLSEDATLDAGDRVIRSTSVRLAGGAAYAGTLTATIPGDVRPSPPSYRLIAAIDADLAIPEPVETDNAALSPSVLTLVAPDLAAARIEGPVVAYHGRRLAVSLELLNRGGARARGVSACLVLSADAVLDAGDRELWASEPMELLAGASRARFEEVVVQADTATGTYRLGLVADCRGAATEADETNNVAFAADPVLVVEPRPDLVAEAIEAPGAVAAGERMEVALRVANLGVLPGAAPYWIVMSDNAGVSAMDPVVYVSAEPLALEPGTERLVSVGVELPRSFPSGRYRVGLVLDPAGGLREPFRANNVVATKDEVFVHGDDLAIVSPPPPPGVVGVPYAWRFAALGGRGSYAWSATFAAGAPPDGLSFDPATAELAGTPTRMALGTHELRVRLSDGGLELERTYSLRIGPPALPLAVVSGKLVPALRRERYSSPIVAVGGVPPYTFTGGRGLPTGLSLGADGVVSGEAEAVGAFLFDVDVTDAVGDSVRETLAIDVIDPAQLISIETADVPATVVGRAYVHEFRATGGTRPYLWRFDGERIPGLSFEPSAAKLVGTATVAGRYPLTIEVRDARGLVDRNAYVLEVFELGRLVVLTSNEGDTALPRGRVGSPYRSAEGGPVALAAGHRDDTEVGELSWIVVLGELPPGLSLDGATGRIEGTPTAAGSYGFAVMAVDPSGDFDRATLLLVVDPDEEGPGPTPDECSCRAAPGGAGAPWLLLGLLLFLGLRARRGRVLVLLFGLLAPRLGAAQTPYLVAQSPAPYVQLAGVELDLSAVGDDGAVLVPIGFPFTYFGHTYTHVNVGVNGVLSFAAPCAPGCALGETCAASNVCARAELSGDPASIPAASLPQRLVAPLWDDLTTDTLSGSGRVLTAVRGTAPNRELVVEWRAVGHIGDVGSEVSFQAILFETTGALRFHYGPFRTGFVSSAWSALVGLEDDTGARGVNPLACGRARAQACRSAQLDGLEDQRIDFTVLSEPELSGRVEAPPRGSPGQALVVPVVIQNLGPVAVEVPFVVDLYATLDATVDPAVDRPIARADVARLDARASLPLAITATLPPDLVPGQYFLGAIFDATMALAEPIESNNVGVSPSRTLVGPDLALRFATTTGAAPGAPIPVDLVLESRGDAVSGVEVRVFVSRDTTLDGSDPAILELVVDAPAAAELPISRTATLPPSLSPGTFSLIAVVDPDLEIAEAIEVNNHAQSDRFVAGPDVSVRVDRVAATAGPDTAYFVDFTVLNLGSPVGAVGYAVYLSVDDQLDPAIDTLVETGTAATGGQRTFAVRVERPLENALPAKLRTIVVVDPASVVAEANESNNRAVTTQTTDVVGPDLVALELRSPAVVVQGEPALFELFVANHGRGRAGAFQLTVHRSDNPTVTLSDPLVFEERVPGVPAGESLILTRAIALAPSTPIGTYHLGLVADANSEIVESQETNNVVRRSGTIEVRGPSPDLWVGAVRTPAVGAAGEKVPIERVFQNLGGRDAVLRYRVVASVDPVLSADDLAIGEGELPLPARGVSVGVDEVRLPGEVLALAIHVGYVLDPDGQVAELDEANNVAFGPPLAFEAGGLAITTESLPIATRGVPYAVDLAARGNGEITWTLDDGALPAGLTLSPSGRLEGTPSAIEVARFQVAAATMTRRVTRSFSLPVMDSARPFGIATAAVPAAWLGRPYEAELTAIGGVLPVRWSVEPPLPAGFQLEPATGRLRGVGAAAANAVHTFVAVDAEGQRAEALMTFRVLAANAGVRFADAQLRDATVGKRYETTFQVEQGISPLRFELASGGLPRGVELEGDHLVGVPAEVGVFPFVLRVVDAREDFDMNHFVLRVSADAGIKIGTVSLPRATTGRAYVDADGLPVVIKGSSPDADDDIAYALVGGELPPGLALGLDGTVTGTPTRSGLFGFVVVAEDTLAQNEVRAFGIAVDDPEPEEPRRGGGGSCACQGARTSGSVLGGLVLVLAALLRRRAALLAALVAVGGAGAASAQTGTVVESGPAAYEVRIGGAPIAISDLDDGAATIELPFAFPFYGVAYDRVTVSTNGYVTFGSTGRAFENQRLPSADSPNNLIALAWDDLLAPRATALSLTVEGQAPRRVAIVQYSGFGSVSGGGSIDAQLWLHEGLSGTFELRYGEVRSGVGLSASVGFEDASGTRGRALAACTPSCSFAAVAALSGTYFRVRQSGGSNLVAAPLVAPERIVRRLPFSVEVGLASVYESALGPFRWSLLLLGERDPGLVFTLRESAPITLDPFAELTVTATAAVPAEVPPGAYRLVLFADSRQELAEPREDDNRAFAGGPSLVLPERPNLVVDAVGVGEVAAAPGATVRVTAALANRGPLDATSEVAVVLSENRVASSEDLRIAGGPVALVAGAESAWAEDVKIPDDLAPGSYYVGVLVDPAGAVEETDELDNARVSDAAVTVAVDALAFKTTSLPAGVVGHEYQGVLVASGGDGRFVFSATGALPSGLTLDASGRLRGRPEAPFDGELGFRVESAGRQAERALRLLVEPPRGPLVIVTRALLPGVVGRGYPPEGAAEAARVFATSGRGAVTVRARSALPAGLTLASDGQLSGTPVEAGTFDLDVEATDGVETATRAIPLTLYEPGRLLLVPVDPPAATVGEGYNHTLAALGRAPGATLDYSLVDGALPDGLVLSPSGALAGIPEKVGRFGFTVEVTESSGTPPPTDRARFDLEVGIDAGFRITPTTLPIARLTEAYEVVFEARRGQPPFSWRMISLTPLPEGLELEIETQDGRERVAIRGTPQAYPRSIGYRETGGVMAFQLEVSDAAGRVAVEPLVLRVLEPTVEEPTEPAPSDCGCRSTAGQSGLGWAGLLGLLAVFARRRAR